MWARPAVSRAEENCGAVLVGRGGGVSGCCCPFQVGSGCLEAGGLQVGGRRVWVQGFGVWIWGSPGQERGPMTMPHVLSQGESTP